MKKFVKILLQIVSAIFIVGVIVLLYFSMKSYNSRVVKVVSLDIACPDDRVMLDEAVIAELLEANINEVLNSSLKDFDDSNIRHTLESVEAIDMDKLVISSGVDGKLIIHIEQKVPVAKLKVADKDNIYITDAGDIITSSLYNGRELMMIGGRIVINGVNTNKSIIRQAAKLVMFIYEDTFLSNRVMEVQISNDDRVAMLVTDLPSPVFIGTLDNLEEKSSNLEYFCMAAKEDEQMYQYESYNLDYKGQVVAINNKK